ncbi:MAG: PKD domain-containing protein [Rhodothermales bacterium]|nr:PKD domain-containing protein [Rhodothermales bacterium]
MTKRQLPTLLILAFAAIGMTLAGCKSVPVDILSMDAPDELQTNETGEFAVQLNEDAKQPVSVSWNFGDDGTDSGAAASHSFDAPGTYTVTATATNRKGKSSDVETATVVVVNPPVPASIVSMNASNMNPDTRTNVRFTANVNGDEPLSYSWSFGDGATSMEASPSHTYAEPGTYDVGLSVSNEHGSDERSMSLAVVWYEAAICSEVAELNAALFAQNSSTLNDAARSALGENLEILSECPNMNVRLEGIAAPGERRAQELSEDRARAVEQFYTDAGVPANRIVTIGNGRTQETTSKKEGLAQYRRVDTIIVR